MNIAIIYQEPTQEWKIKSVGCNVLKGKRLLCRAGTSSVVTIRVSSLTIHPPTRHVAPQSLSSPLTPPPRLARSPYHVTRSFATLISISSSIRMPTLPSPPPPSPRRDLRLMSRAPPRL
ncbi:hypothetical protein BC938DRAFT_472939 [Jimgerdemannia flammicorona]|uniref:Uncharacterized protein n=1 Tax=Jimgerdemannia flammicorona TaxID=994334 RepID=A0A433Q538_9FUNG|nr:hypothetical protein BC938DRAFT_472939 [Jimgerdemannia flammicorona]